MALNSASTAYTTCEATYKLIQGIKKAPKDINRVATDLKGFYSILGALQNSVQTENSALSKPGPAAHQLENIAALIGDCVAAFREGSRFTALNGEAKIGLSEAFKWESLQKEDVQYLRLIFGRLVVTSTHNEVLAVRRDISNLQDQLKKYAVKRAANHTLLNRASIASVSSSFSLRSTSSMASSHESIKDFVAETEILVAGLDHNELTGVPSLEEPPTIAGALVALAQRQPDANVEREAGVLAAEVGEAQNQPRHISPSIIANISRSVRAALTLRLAMTVAELVAYTEKELDTDAKRRSRMLEQGRSEISRCKTKPRWT
ncbi:hypothetical protein LTR56_025033 [Elasticomyces elasticus]|nr:hypothetical protein LTR56_025033 [Elasticomyces elasticus]